MPPLSFESAFLMRIFLVSAFFPDMTQQIHSLRARGVMSFHIANAAGVEASAIRKSCGMLCTTPPEIAVLAIQPVYQKVFVLSYCFRKIFSIVLPFANSSINLSR